MKSKELKKKSLSVNGRNVSYQKIVAGVGLALAMHGGISAQTSYCTNNCGIGGTDNAAFGPNVLTSITSGQFNTGVGRWALVYTTTGYENVALGGSAMGYNTSGYRNAACGYGSIGNSTTGHDNAAFGYYSAINTNTGYENTAIGSKALYSNQAGIGSTAVGFEALYSDTYNNGSHANQAFGYKAMRANTTGQQNTAVGYECLTSNTGAHNNAAFGMYTMRLNTTGGDNAAFGCVALSNNTSGGHNTAFGTLALNNNGTGSYNTGLGRGADVTGTFNNATALGSAAAVNASDRVFLGDANVINNNVWSYGTYNTVSDGRFKTNVSEADVKGLDFIKLLRPVVYNFEAKKATEYVTKNMSEESKKLMLDKDFSKATEVRQSGFIAQEVADAAQKSGYNFNAVHSPESDVDTYGLAYGQFVVPLVKAVQEQQVMIEAQQKQLNEQKALIDALLKSGSATGIGSNGTAAGFSMDQNVPNPFSHETTIKYTVTNDTKTAVLNVYDLSGKQISSFPLTEKGTSSITITSDKLAAGIYIYSVVADGKIVDTKRMVVEQK